MSSASSREPSPGPDFNPYTTLNVEKTASSGDIRKAYLKLALTHHPDKSSAADAKATFQTIVLAYSILSDPARREIYDTTGSTHPDGPAGEAGFDWAAFYKARYAEAISVEKVEEFRKAYQGGDEEKGDVLKAYVEGKGSWEYIFEHVMCSEVERDEERFKEIIDKAIKEKEVEEFKGWKKENTKAARNRRLKAARKEEGEAEEMAREMGVHEKLFGKDKKTGKKKSVKESEDALADIIRKKNANKMDDMIANLEAKYVNGGAKPKKGRKRRSEEVEEGPPEIDDEEFERLQKKVTAKKGKGKELKEEAPTRRSKRAKA